MTHDNVPPLTPKLVAGVPADRLLSSNLAALSACDLDLAKRVAQAQSPPLGHEVVVRPSASGLPTVSAGPFLIHSAQDPIAEAEAQAARIPKDAGRVMALGFGAGHLLSVLLHRNETVRLDVVALHPAVLRAVAGAVDLKPLLCNPRLRFLADEKQPLPPHFVVVPPLLHLAEPARADLRDAALDVLAVEASAQRLSRKHDRWEQNQLANRAIAAADPSVAALYGTRPGAPVFIAAAGPSLTALLPTLLRVFSPRSGRQRSGADAVLLCLPEALPALSQQGIVPDLVVAIDGRGEPPARPGKSPVGLVYVPVIEPQWPATWNGPRHVAGIASLAPGNRGEDLRSDGSELLLAVDLGRRLGASALVLVGADLCASPGQRDAQAPSFTRQVPGIGGKTVAAGAAQIACRRSLEAYCFEHRPLPVINTSPLGVRIAGASEQSLADVFARLKLEVNHA